MPNSKKKNWIYRLATKSAEKDDTPIVAQKRVAFIIALFFALFGDLVFFSIYWLSEAKVLMLAVGANTLLLCTQFVLFQFRGTFVWVRVISTLSTTLVLAFVAGVLGERTGAENLLIAVIGVATAFFSDQERKWIVVTIVTCVASLILFKFGFPDLASLPDSQQVYHLISRERFYYICETIAAATLSVVFLNLRFQQDAAVFELEERKAKMQHTSQLAALGEMAGGIAHEINNPLAVIQGKLTLIKLQVESESPSKKKILENVTGARETVKRISQIVTGMKTIARDGTHDPYAKINLSTVIENTLQLCEERFRYHGVTLDLEKLDKNIEVEAQEVSIGQVFLNLLNNAFDSIQTQENKWIKISSHFFKNKIEIKIIDSGAGIKPADREKIFRPFFTTKETGKGTGLGLSISKGILESHGGDLIYDFRQSNTTFVVSLPRPKS